MANLGPLAPMLETEPMRVLQECIDVLRKKGSDYQNPNSRVRQADYYEHGLVTLMDIIQAKRLRVVSLMEGFEASPYSSPNFESIEDSLKDMANYCAIAAAWCRGKIDGQDPSRDILNRKKPLESPGVPISEGGLSFRNSGIAYLDKRTPDAVEKIFGIDNQ